MARKTYRSSTVVSVNIMLPSGKSKHIGFEAASNGSSSYTTEDGGEQKGLESHYKFGKLYRISEVTELSDGRTERSVNERSNEKPEIRKLQFSDLAAARDYIAEEFGVSKLQLRSGKSIIDAGRSKGIEVVIEN